MRPDNPCPSVTMCLLVDDQFIGTRTLPATRTSNGRTQQLNHAMRRLQRTHPDAQRWEVAPSLGALTTRPVELMP